MPVTNYLCFVINRLDATGMKTMKRLLKTLALAAALGAALTSCKSETYYTVTFEPNGGRIEGDVVITVAEGDIVPFPNAPAPPGRFWLTGWYTDAELIDEWDFYSDAVTGDMTLYAGWGPLYAFTFYGNGGTFQSNGGVGEWTMDYLDEGYCLPIPANVIKPGYVLEGWYRDDELTDKWDFNTDTVTGDGALYANWEATIEGLTRDNYPRVDGATSTRALNVMVACKLLGLPYEWWVIPETRENSVGPRGESINSAGNFFDGRIQTSQTYGAIMNLIDGSVDIVLRSTTASPDEKAEAEAAGVTLVETPIALDAFVFLKHPSNSVESLTLEQIRKIYTGQITDWSEVGGERAAMRVFTRPRNSGSEEALRELVMNGTEPAEFSDERQIASMAGLFWEMEREKYGIGYIFKNYKETVMRRREPVFAIDGIAPGPATMRDRTYPLTTEVYAIIRSDLDPDSMAYRLYEWLQSDSSNAVLEECGFLPN